MRPETVSIALTANEVLGIEAVLKNEDREELMHNAKGLLLKIGSAFLDQQAKGMQTVALALTEAELWLLRDKVSTSLRIGPDVVGLSIKQKIYPGLLWFDTQRAMPPLETTPNIVDPDPTSSGRLSQWQDQQQGGGKSNV